MNLRVVNWEGGAVGCSAVSTSVSAVGRADAFVLKIEGVQPQWLVDGIEQLLRDHVEAADSDGHLARVSATVEVNCQGLTAPAEDGSRKASQTKGESLPLGATDEEIDAALLRASQAVYDQVTDLLVKPQPPRVLGPEDRWGSETEYLLQVAESASPPDILPDASGDVVFEAKDGWKVAFAYRSGKLSHIAHFTRPHGYGDVDFWDWPCDTPGLILLGSWSRVGDYERMKREQE